MENDALCGLNKLVLVDISFFIKISSYSRNPIWALIDGNISRANVNEFTGFF